MTLNQNIEKLQDALNEYITPNWKNVRTEVDFMVANNQEVAELIDSAYQDEDGKHELGWKWWKGGDSTRRTTDKIDWNSIHPKVVDNVKIELTDLLFFTLSQKVIGSDFTGEDEQLPLSENDWVNFLSITAHNLLQRPGAALQIIYQLSERLNFNIYAYYIAKLTLNYIRQLGGYGTTYKKVIDGVEDNELLHQTIEGVTIDDMKNNFEPTANKIMEKVYEAFNVKDERKFVKDWFKIVEERDNG